MRIKRPLQTASEKHFPVPRPGGPTAPGTGVSRSRAGVTLIELLVVSTIMVLIAAISLPILQLVRQREKENRLQEVLTYVRSSGLGVGTPRYSNESYSVNNIEFASDGYRNFMVRKIMGQVGVSGFTYTDASYAIATGTFHGIIYPLNPSAVIFALGQSVSFPTVDGAWPPAAASVTVKVTQRFIRNIPPHPFEDWYPGAHWEFKAATDTAADGPWFASSTVAPLDPWSKSPPEATGVIDIRSVGAGISISGENTDTW